ncbi:hypothetical protein J7J90_03185 [Candidatus Micrarchaeota archaeon]|nr:hypothetical protein [Candidatus Micrarchaeota archaeon]
MEQLINKNKEKEQLIETVKSKIAEVWKRKIISDDELIKLCNSFGIDVNLITRTLSAEAEMSWFVDPEDLPEIRRPKDPTKPPPFEYITFREGYDNIKLLSDINIKIKSGDINNIKKLIIKLDDILKQDKHNIDITNLTPKPVK